MLNPHETHEGLLEGEHASFCSRFIEQNWVPGTRTGWPGHDCLSNSNVKEFKRKPFVFSDFLPRFKTCALVGSSGETNAACAVLYCE